MNVMKCHIVPMSYLKSWSTDETKKEKRAKREVYCCYVSKDSQSMYLTRTKNITEDTIVAEDIYITEKTQSFVEDNMNQKYESQWNDFISHYEVMIKDNQIISYKVEFLLEFMLLQLLRTFVYMETAIGGAYDKVINILKSAFPELYEALGDELKNEYIAEKFVDIIKKFLCGEKYPIVEMLKNDFFRLKKVCLVSNKNSYFWTCDVPIVYVANEQDFKGFYMPITPKICVYLYDNNKTNKMQFDICRVSNRVVKFVNHIIMDNARNVVISNIETMENRKSNVYPHRDYMKIKNKA